MTPVAGPPIAGSAVNPRVFALVGLALTLAGIAGTAIVRGGAPVPLRGAFGFDQATQIGYLVEAVTWGSIGALLVVRQPANVVGWFMVAIGVGFSLSQVSVSLAFAFEAEGTADGMRVAQVAGWATVLLQLVTILQVAIGFLFPTGQVQGPRWGIFMRLFWSFAVVFVVLALIQSGPLQLLPGIENPVGLIPDLRGGQPIAPFLMFFTTIILGGLILSLGLRYRAAGRVERQQLKWFVLALSVSAVGLGIAQIETTYPGPAVQRHRIDDLRLRRGHRARRDRHRDPALPPLCHRPDRESDDRVRRRHRRSRRRLLLRW